MATKVRLCQNKVQKPEYLRACKQLTSELFHLTCDVYVSSVCVTPLIARRWRQKFQSTHLRSKKQIVWVLVQEKMFEQNSLDYVLMKITLSSVWFMVMFRWFGNKLTQALTYAFKGLCHMIKANVPKHNISYDSLL